MATTRITTAADGTQSNGFSEDATFSPDGTRVIFESGATNLVPGDTNGARDIFVKTLATGAITRVSTSEDGTQSTSTSENGVFSPDGTKVAFRSSGTNLIPNDTNGASDIFVKDLATGEVTSVTRAADGTQGNGGSGSFAFSGDGSRIVFSSEATNLVPNDTNGVDDIFVKDLASGAITRVSTDADGNQGNSFSFNPVISPDGSKVAFVSQADNLVDGDDNGVNDIFIKDLSTGEVTLASQATDGRINNDFSDEPVFSPDGTKLAFSSGGSNITPFPFDGNGAVDIFVRDIASGTVTRVSTTSDGSETNGDSRAPVFSPDGTKIAFLSAATNLTPGDTNRVLDGFVKDLNTGAVTRVPATGVNGAEPNGATQGIAFAPDGRSVVVASNASNLVPGDFNGEVDIFKTDIPCYMTGTRILTSSGEAAVEDLKVDDLVVTALGEHRPIRWIGHQATDCRNHPRPGTVLPVRITRGALGPNKPTRDLWVSPRHAICLDLIGEVLVPADALINGATITQVPVDTVTYWHVELDSHDLLVAEGVAAESYLDIGNRGFFAGARVGPDEAVPGGRLTRADSCRPFVEADSAIVAFARERLRARAVALGWTAQPDPVAGLHLVADGRIIEPTVDGTTARFTLPAGCGDIRLVSETTVPALVTGSGDRRRLGVNLRGLTIEVGATAPQPIALDDARLVAGFRSVEGSEGARHRWTRGDALLPATLWAGIGATFVLRLELGGERLARWQAPGDASQRAEGALAEPPEVTQLHQRSSAAA